MIRLHYRFLVALAGVTVLPGCGILGPDAEEQLGVVRYHADTTAVYLPSSVAADSSFSVRFHTFGGGCERAVRTTVELSERLATVTPIDEHSGADTCTDILKFLQHEALVRFTTTGPATVVVIGGSEPGGGTLELSFPVVVREQ